MVQTEALLAVLEGPHDAVVSVIVLVDKGERLDPIDAVEALGATSPAGGTQDSPRLGAEYDIAAKVVCPQDMAEEMFGFAEPVKRRRIEVADSELIGLQNDGLELLEADPDTGPPKRSCAKPERCELDVRITQFALVQSSHVANALIGYIWRRLSYRGRARERRSLSLYRLSIP